MRQQWASSAPEAPWMVNVASPPTAAETVLHTFIAIVLETAEPPSRMSTTTLPPEVPTWVTDAPFGIA